jgi:hypothetical protein
MRKPSISRNSQCKARVLSAAAVGSREQKRWIVQEDLLKGSDIQWINGSAQPSLIEESKGYVRAALHRTVQKSAYDSAPLHRVEIWCHEPNSEFHVRIFEEIAPVSPV